MDWIELIKGLGFPIALSAFLVYRDSRDKQSMVKRIELLEKQRLEKEEKRSDRFAEVIERNTVALNNTSNALNTRPCLHNTNLTGA